jgi:predicted GNAT family N-acyltransferase
VDEMSVDEFLDIVTDLRQRVKDLERRCRRLEIENGDYEEEQDDMWGVMSDDELDAPIRARDNY